MRGAPSRMESLGGLFQEYFSFENVLRVAFRLSRVHTLDYETKGSQFYCTATMDHLSFYKTVLKTNCRCESALIRYLEIEKRTNQPTLVERKGAGIGERGGERGGEGGGERGGERGGEGGGEGGREGGR